MKRVAAMYTKTYSVIELLANASTTYVTSSQLSHLLGISTRMVFRYIKEAQEYGTEHGYEILSFKGKGYQLQVRDKEVFREFCATYGTNQSLIQDKELVQKVIKKILLTDGYKLDDLAELFSYSRSSMSRLTVAANVYLELFRLDLVSKAYTGLYVRGDEISIRDCMYHLYQETESDKALWQQMELYDIAFEEVNDWLEAWLVNEKIQASPQERKQFLTYLAIALKRISLGKSIDFGYLANLEDLEPLQKNMKNISEMLIRYFPASSLNGESMYLALIRMQTFKKNSTINHMAEHNMIFFHNLIIEALEKIQHNYGVDLSDDEYLINGLTFHVASSYGKYLLHMETENPFYEELQKSYPTAYYYSIELAECISKYTKTNMSSNELGFLTMHFASCMERNLGVRKWKTAILGNNAFGTSLLLKSRIEKQYESIEVIGIYPGNEPELIPRNVDFYISPNHLEQNGRYEHEVLQLSPLLNEEDQDMVSQLLSRLKSDSDYLKMVDHCSKDRFFRWNKPMKKKTLLTKLCNEMEQRGYMTKEDEQALFDREILVSTEIASNIAMPHCLIEGQSFLSFVLLDSPMGWGKASVRLVILVCFQKGDPLFKEVLEKLFLIIKNGENVDKLLSCTSYEEFIACMEKFDGGNLC